MSNAVVCDKCGVTAVAGGGSECKQAGSAKISEPRVLGDGSEIIITDEELVPRRALAYFLNE